MLDSHLDSSQQTVGPQMGPSRIHSSSSSGIFFQGDGQSQALGNNSHLGSFGNSTNPFTGNMHSNMAPVSGDMNNTVLNNVASSGPSAGASSLVTDDNSGLSGCGPRLQRSASINTESYMRLPTSPLSFSSNNISISGSSIIDGPSNQDPHSQQVQQPVHHQGAGASSATSLGPPRIGQVSLSLPNGSRIPGSFIPDHDNVFHLQKKPRLEMKQEDMIQQQVLQQILQRQDSLQLQSPNPQLQALIQQQRQRQQQQQQQQLLQSLPPGQRAHLLQQQQQQLQLRQQLQQQGLQPALAMKRPFDGSVCSRRLMQYLYHQRQHPADNGISYWRKFVEEYYSPRAKKRWCLSLYNNVGHHSLGVFPQAAMDAWQCDICGSKSGKGFEATFEVLPRLNEIKFGSGVIDELLFLGMPREYRLPSGVMMLEYGQAVQESVYEQLRVVREGQLKVVFAPDLKILTWEFCARRHEELLPRRLVTPQVNQLLQVAQKCQSTIAESGSDGVSQQDLQTNSNMVLMAGRQLAKSLELHSLNDLGFSKRYVRCLQICEVVNSMKDLMGFCSQTKTGPLEGLKAFPQAAAKLQAQKMQELDQFSSVQQLQTDQNALSKLVSMNPLATNNHLLGTRGNPLGGPAQNALALSTYQTMLMRRSSMNAPSQLEPPSNPNPNGGSPFRGSPLRSLGGAMFQGQPPQHHHHQPPPPAAAAMQHQMIHQLLQDMNNSGGGAKPSFSGGGGAKPSFSGQSAASGGGGFRVNGPTPPTRSGGQKAPDLTHYSDNVVSEFMENGVFGNGELDDSMCYGWKA